MNERKKILWLTSWYPNKNERFDGDFIQRHARAAAIHHDVHVIFVTEADLDHALEEEWNYATGLTEQTIYFKRTAGLLKRTRRHVIWKSLLRGAIKKYIDHHGKPDAVHVQVPWKAGLIALWLKRTYGLPYIVTEHWGIYDRNAKEGFYNFAPFVRKELRTIYGEASQVVTVSQFLSQSLQAAVGRGADRILPNVVDTSLFYQKNEKHSKFTFIHVSNMVPVKNADLILQAFASLVRKTTAPVQLVMVGNRDSRLLDLAAQLDVLNTSVFFRGELPYTAVAEEMRKAHCFVLFSDSETFSCVTAEALCAGLPVITRNTGALPELVNEKNGRLVLSKEVSALVEAMVFMVDHYQQFSPAAIAGDASSKYGYSTVAQAFQELYA